MIKISINNKEIETEKGLRIMEVAAAAGIDIPAMCSDDSLEHFTSCMICLVKERSTGTLFPSCSMPVSDGMDIITDDEEIEEARRTAVELLLSEHLGDCEAPCRNACPALMDIPLMNRLIAAGMKQQALEVVAKEIALPGVMGRICPAPCEAACKRAQIDQAVSVCLLKRFAADSVTFPHHNAPKEELSTTVAIIGAGAAGLAAANFLSLNGIGCVIFDRNSLPGGEMRYSIPDDQLDKAVLDREIAAIKEMGVLFNQNRQIGITEFETLRAEYKAVIVATGNYSAAMDGWGLDNDGKQIIINKTNYQTNLERVFAIGNANRPQQMAIRSAAQGKEVAHVIVRMLKGEQPVAKEREFNSILGKLLPDEHAEYLKEGSHDQRQFPGKGAGGGFTVDEAITEASRCMHCDCRKPDSCLLRIYAGKFRASQRRFRYSARKSVVKSIQQGMVVFEPGKCIKCGICVRLTARHREEFGFTFIGRGFDVEIGVPFNESINKALEKTVVLVCNACPTGALASLAQKKTE